MRKVVYSIAITLYLAIYSIKQFDLGIIRPWLRCNDNALRLMAIFITYVLSVYIASKGIKNHKVIKVIFILNAMVFIFVISI